MNRLRTFHIFFLFVILLFAAAFTPPAISKIKDGMLFGKVTTQQLDEKEPTNGTIMSVEGKISLIIGYQTGEENIVMVSQEQQIDTQQNAQDIVRIVLDEIEILKNNGIFPQTTISNNFQYFNCTMKTYSNMNNPGVNTKIWDMSFTSNENVVNLWIDVDSHRVYQFNVWTKGSLPALDIKEIPQAFAAYLGLTWDEISYKPGVWEYTAGNGEIIYQFIQSDDGNSYSIQMISGRNIKYTYKNDGKS